MFYSGIKFDDVTTDENGHKWSQICEACVERSHVSSKIISNPGSGICGVEGCNNEADFYIDFPDVESDDKTYHQKTIYISPQENAYYNELLNMTGDQIYEKYGLKRDEAFVHTAHFDDNVEIDVKLVICDGENKPYVEAVTLKEGEEQGFTDPDEIILGEWYGEADNEAYTVYVAVR
jgi:hypothetical protein